ncbi:MAG: S49 family peptidase [Alphaproteobacteria bacterium]
MKLHSLVTRSLFRQSAPVVAVLRLSGVLGGFGPFPRGLTLAGVASGIERAFSMRGVRAVALSINSPGGSAVQAALIYKRVRVLAAEKDVKVYTFAEDVAASGGYWLACAGDEIFAHECSIIGSIGVITASFGFDEAITRLGIARRVHTAGDKKKMLDPFLPEDPVEVARLKTIQSDIHDSFKGLVRERRRGRLVADEAEVFTGEFWTGRRAKELGFVDGIGDLRSVMRARYGDKVKLRLIGAPRPWLRRRLGVEGVAVSPADWASALLWELEARSLWSRYGL